jgi:hypothetical protein
MRITQPRDNAEIEIELGGDVVLRVIHVEACSG